MVYWLLFLRIDLGWLESTANAGTLSNCRLRKAKKWSGFHVFITAETDGFFGKITNSIIDNGFQGIDNRNDIDIRAINRFRARSLQAYCMWWDFTALEGVGHCQTLSSVWKLIMRIVSSELWSVCTVTTITRYTWCINSDKWIINHVLMAIPWINFCLTLS